MAITTNTKISTPVLSQVEGERAKAEHSAKAAPKQVGNPITKHEEVAETHIATGLADVTPEEVAEVVNEARARANTAFFSDLKGNSLNALGADQSKKQTTYCKRTAVSVLLGKL